MGWLIVTILVPLLAPNIALYFLSLVPLEEGVAEKIRWTAPLKDGQLCWLAIGFSSAALYEMGVAGEGKLGLINGFGGYFQGGFILLLFASGLLASAGAAFPKPPPATLGTSPFRHYTAMSVSFVLTGLSATAYAVVHFQAKP